MPTFFHLNIILNYPVFIVDPVAFALSVPKKSKKKKKKGEKTKKLHIRNLFALRAMGYRRTLPALVAADDSDSR
jgi:hypothetical protein